MVLVTQQLSRLRLNAVDDERGLGTLEIGKETR